MELTEQLQLLQDAQGDPAKLALARVDIAFAHLSPSERAALKKVFETVAVPRLCDVGILNALLRISKDECFDLISKLREFRLVESLPQSEDDESPIGHHGADRMALRRRLATYYPDRFRNLNQRAANYFAKDYSVSGRIEWIYHSLCCCQQDAAVELERLNRDWTGSNRPGDRQALAAALQDLEETGLVSGRAYAWLRVTIARAHFDRGHTIGLDNDAREIQALARSAEDGSAEANILCLLGELLEGQGRLDDALYAFKESLAIYRSLIEKDPGNSGWQLDLATAHTHAGIVLEAQQNLDEAYNEFKAALLLVRTLAEREPINVVLQKNWAAAHSQVGEILRARAQLLETQNRKHTPTSHVQEKCMPQAERQRHVVVHETCSGIESGHTHGSENVRPARLFICYSSLDTRGRRNLESTLCILQARGMIDFWFDRMISPGDDWDETIQERLKASDIVLFLVSRHFLASPYIQTRELPQALEQHKNGRSSLIPFILSRCSWDKSPLFRLQTATGDRRPLSEWRDKEAAYHKVESQLEIAWRELQRAHK